MFAVTLAYGRTFDSRADATRLDAARRQGLVFEYSCLPGEARTLGSEEALSSADQAQGHVLPSARVAGTDANLGIEGLSSLADAKIRTLPARIDSLQALAPDMLHVVPRLPPNAGFIYVPGQYVKVI